MDTPLKFKVLRNSFLLQLLPSLDVSEEGAFDLKQIQKRRHNSTIKKENKINVDGWPG